MKKFMAMIKTTVGGSPVITEIYANDSRQAKQLIELLPYFKSFIKQPYAVKS